MIATTEGINRTLPLFRKTPRWNEDILTMNVIPTRSVVQAPWHHFSCTKSHQGESVVSSAELGRVPVPSDSFHSQSCWQVPASFHSCPRGISVGQK